MLIRRGERSGRYTIAAVHSTALGPALGGCRLWPYEDTRAALRDALRLSRGMTLKSAAAGLPLGGGKGVIVLRPGERLTPRARRAVLEDFGDTVQALQGAYVTAEDVGVTAGDMEVLATRTPHVTGRARSTGGSGDPSPLTALGVQAALAAALEHRFGSPSLRGRTVSVVGLGHVGLRLARGLAKAGAQLLVHDVDPARRADADRLGARWVEAGEARTAPVDVFCPCALGGVLDPVTVAELQAPIVAGAANNQLADDAVAEQLSERGVLWVPDFVANAGGIINIAVELEDSGYDPARARERVRAIGQTTRQVLEEAAAQHRSPLHAAMALAQRRLDAAARP